MELEQLLLSLRSDGFCVVPGVIPSENCSRIRERLSNIVTREGRRPGVTGVDFLAGVINFEQSFAPYLANTRLLGLVQSLLGEHVRISFTSAIINPPGNPRGGWHADWPFNQENAGHIPAPYPDMVAHLTTLWMLSPFSAENGGTLVLPGSHRRPTNPTDGTTFSPHASLPAERNVTGSEGSVCVMDSRLWHATSPNRSPEPRVALVVRYAPWWLNLEVLRPESDDRKRMVEETGKPENLVPPVPRRVFEQLPDSVKALYRHWVVPCARQGDLVAR